MNLNIRNGLRGIAARKLRHIRPRGNFMLSDVPVCLPSSCLSSMNDESIFYHFPISWEFANMLRKRILFRRRHKSEKDSFMMIVDDCLWIPSCLSVYLNMLGFKLLTICLRVIPFTASVTGLKWALEGHTEHFRAIYVIRHPWLLLSITINHELWCLSLRTEYLKRVCGINHQSSIISPWLPHRNWGSFVLVERWRT
jgi:hypothetical protein